MDMNRLNLNSLKHTVVVWIPIFLIVLFVLNNTTPDRLGPQGVTFFFIALYLFFSLSINLLWRLAVRFLGDRRIVSVWQPSYSFVYGFIPTMALALESLDQLILRDVIIFIGLAFMIGFYVVKRPR